MTQSRQRLLAWLTRANRHSRRLMAFLASRYRSPVHHSKGREILNAVGCKLGGSVIVVNSKKGKGHTLKLNDASAGLSPDHALDGSRATEADASQDPAPAEFSRLVVGEVPSASQEL